MCTSGSRAASILAGFRARLTNDRDAEVATALGEIAKIYSYRLIDIVRDTSARG